MGSGKKWSTKVVATLGLRKTVLNVVLGDGIHVGAVVARSARIAIWKVSSVLLGHGRRQQCCGCRARQAEQGLQTGPNFSQISPAVAKLCNFERFSSQFIGVFNSFY